ncbi:MAG: hypothetical protein ACR2LX_03625 [Jatrophihabitans sp.]
MSVSAHGSASANASSGAGAATTTSVRSAVAHPHVTTPSSPAQIAEATRSLVASLMTANGGSVLGADPVSALPGASGSTQKSLSVDVAMTSGPDGQCSAADSCTAAVSVSVGGSARASILPIPRCTSRAGNVLAVAVAVDAAARASARQGVADTCAVTTAGGAGLEAGAGSSGSVVGVSLAQAGSARTDAVSGALGDTTIRIGGTQPTSPISARSGTSGDAASVAIGRDAATASARSGHSGDASAVCDRCAAAHDGMARSVTGNTGLTYSLAGAGRDAIAAARSGDSGSAAALALGPDARSSLQASYSSARVQGRSGDTGNVIAVAVDRSTWVHVYTDSGATGIVTSRTLPPASQKPGHPSTGVYVGPSGSGHRRTITGNGSATSTVAAASEKIESSSTASVTSSSTHASSSAVPIARKPEVRADRGANPRSATSLERAAGFWHRNLLSDAGSPAGVVGIATGGLVFAALVILATAAWIRSRRSRR